MPVLMFKILFSFSSLIIFLLSFSFPFCYSLWFCFAMKFKMKSSLHLLKQISIKTWLTHSVRSTIKVGLTRYNDFQISLSEVEMPSVTLLSTIFAFLLAVAVSIHTLSQCTKYTNLYFFSLVIVKTRLFFAILITSL